MPRRPTPPQVMGAWEIRQRLGYTREWVEKLIRGRDFPAPWIELRMGRIWLAEDVEAWIRVNRPEIDEPEGP